VKQSPRRNVPDETSSPASIAPRNRARGERPLLPARDKHIAVLQMGFALAALALFSTTPAVWEAIAVWQNPAAPPLPPWVLGIFALGVVQLAYAVYLAQLPDWSALWATTLAMLGLAALYALLLGTTLMAREENILAEMLGFAEKLPGNRAAMWCFVMLCFTGVATYFLGFTAARWYRAYRVLRDIHEA
jgi:hypothetical protein